jgi:hypothetical protein
MLGLFSHETAITVYQKARIKSHQSTNFLVLAVLNELKLRVFIFRLNATKRDEKSNVSECISLLDLIGTEIVS